VDVGLIGVVAAKSLEEIRKRFHQQCRKPQGNDASPHWIIHESVVRADLNEGATSFDKRAAFDQQRQERNARSVPGLSANDLLPARLKLSRYGALQKAFQRNRNAP